MLVSATLLLTFSCTSLNKAIKKILLEMENIVKMCLYMGKEKRRKAILCYLQSMTVLAEKVSSSLEASSGWNWSS